MKPTKGQIVQKIAQAWCTARNSQKEMDTAIVEDAADAVIALFENKPRPKWEEEFWNMIEDNKMVLGNEPTRDFIREKLEELFENATNGPLSEREVKEKWGL